MIQVNEAPGGPGLSWRLDDTVSVKSNTSTMKETVYSQNHGKIPHSY